MATLGSLVALKCHSCTLGGHWPPILLGYLDNGIFKYHYIHSLQLLFWPEPRLNELSSTVENEIDREMGFGIIPECISLYSCSNSDGFSTIFLLGEAIFGRPMAVQGT